MVQIGYTFMCEQRSPKEMVQDAVLAERAGFDFSVISDHYHPWTRAQGHSGYAWSILGALAQATTRLPLMTYVTAPIIRYHPAIVAQKAATMAILSDGRFRLGLGAGEELNEHVVGKGYPPVDVRHEMLTEAIEIIRALWRGKPVTYHGKHYDVEGARLFDLPPAPPQIGVAVSGKQSCGIAGRMGDLVVAIEPKAELIQQFRLAGGAGKPAVGQITVCWGSDEQECVQRAHEQFGWSLGNWKILSELPNYVNFEAFVQTVTPEQVARKIPCGPDPEKIVQSVKQFVDAGFTEVALVQGGQNQAEFCDFYARELAPALKAL